MYAFLSFNLKKTGINIVFFTFGMAAFAYLVYRFGIGQITANIEKAGWSLLSIIGVWFVVYMLNASAWKLVLGKEGAAVSFPRLFRITVSGFVINYITPVIALGGEPYKVRALSSTLGTQHSLSAVVLYRMVHLIGHMLVLLTGTVAALIFIDLPGTVRLALLVLCAVMLTIITLTLSGHRKGVFQRIKDLIARFGFLKRLHPILQKYESDLHDMDGIVTHAYRNERKKFYLSVLIEFCSRILMGAEVYLIMRGIGVETTFVSALFLFVSYSIIINVMFFIPFNLGAREGGLVLGLGSLALPPLLGVYLGVVMRIREFFWILLGLLFILLTTNKNKSVPVKVL